MRLLGIIRNNPAPYKKFRSALGHERPRPTAAAAAVKKFSAKTFYPRLCWIAAEVKSLLGSLHNNEPKRMNEMDNVEGGRATADGRLQEQLAIRKCAHTNDDDDDDATSDREPIH